MTDDARVVTVQLLETDDAHVETVQLLDTCVSRCDGAIGLCLWLLPGAFIGLGVTVQLDYARVTCCNWTMTVLPAAFIGLSVLPGAFGLYPR